MIIRWRNAQGERCSMVVDSPIEIEADTYREDGEPRGIKIRAPGQAVTDWALFRPRVISAHED
jgi:hypothetical protein